MNQQRFIHCPLSPLRIALAATLLLPGTAAAGPLGINLPRVGELETPAAEHIDQSALTSLIAAGKADEAFETAFEIGDELFATRFNALDGGGANVGQGQRFTRTPRADLNAFDEWASHFPARATGPNGQACTECHLEPVEDGAGGAATNVSRDPGHTADPGAFINRNTPHVFGLGALQRLAEEMHEELVSLRDQAIADARTVGGDVTVALTTKSVSFGFITARRDGSLDTSQVEGIDPDLVVRPFQWKGSVASIRDFVRGAAHNELGIQGVELVGDDLDGDFDGVSNEITVGDVTALTLYNAAQPRPTTLVELSRKRLIPPLSHAEVAAIDRGKGLFEQTGCAECHQPRMELHDPIFSEPSGHASYRDKEFPGGQDPVSRGVDPESPLTFDLTEDQPDNRILGRFGQIIFHLGAFEKSRSGGAVVRLYGDLKRHDMGPGLAESIDETGSGASVFLTENLWGVGSTAPYLHDGRATTLTEAILEHGGEADESRQAFQALSTQEQAQLIAFLDNLLLHKIPEENMASAGPKGSPPTPFKRKRHRH